MRNHLYITSRVFQSTLPGWGATDKEAGTRLARQISIHAPRMGSDLRWRRRCVPRSHFNPRSPDGERLERKGRQLHATTISIHAPRMGSDQETIPIGLETQFQSTLPGWGATGCSRCHHRRTVYFNPRSPDGERRSIRASARPTIHFNPRSPDGERLSNVYDLVNRLRFQSTLPGWGATRLPDAIRGTPKRFQSTLPGWGATFVEFSRAGSVGFQSTLPGWGATCRSACSPCLSRHFNPRSPDGERPRAPRCSTRTSRYFNPRSPDGERRLRHRNTMVTEKFQSTLPGWGATRAVVRAVPKVAISIHAPRMGSDHDGVPDHVPSGLISIHAPRMGSDPMRRGYGLGCWNFNPRSPDGERRMLVPASSMVTVFQSTLPGWGATWSVYVPIWYTLFQSTLPGWGATATAVGLRVPAGISIHAPRMGSDPSRLDNNTVQVKFQSTLPGWGATAPLPTAPTRSANFNPRSPGGERPLHR